MEQPFSSSSPHGSRRREETEFNLRDWGIKARNISRENTSSRRFSASYIRSFREDTRSFRSNITISSTASSPGYSLRDEIDPSTYSFTTALQALQARAAYNCWECISPDGFSLNSKWNEAEKYICNPLSGEFPMECLSAKTLSGRSFRNLNNRITMSAPLICTRQTQTHTLTGPSHNNSYNTPSQDHDMLHHFPIPEMRVEAMMMTRDVGTQSTPPDQLSSSSLSPASTPPIIERSSRIHGGDSPNSNAKLVFEEQVKVKETRKEEEDEDEETRIKEEKTKGKDDDNYSKQKHRRGGCLSWMSKRHRGKHKTRKNKLFLPILNKGC